MNLFTRNTLPVHRKPQLQFLVSAKEEGGAMDMTFRYGGQVFVEKREGTCRGVDRDVWESPEWT